MKKKNYHLVTNEEVLMKEFAERYPFSLAELIRLRPQYNSVEQMFRQLTEKKQDFC